MRQAGIIGSGNIGSAVTQRLVAKGWEVLMANKRGPASAFLSPPMMRRREHAGSGSQTAVSASALSFGGGMLSGFSRALTGFLSRSRMAEPRPTRKGARMTRTPLPPLVERMDQREKL